MQTSIKYIPHGKPYVDMYSYKRTNGSDNYDSYTELDIIRYILPFLLRTHCIIRRISFSISFCNEIFCIGANGNVIIII